MATKAIALMSGGLDSCLAVRVIQEQGIEVIGIHCRHPFHIGPPPGRDPNVNLVAAELGIELVEPDVTERMIELVKSPPHGRGRNLNPCVDCRILYLNEGAKLMRERDASFIITGEVIGQRPMSQRRDSMDVIDRDSGLRGKILRPLTAKRLKPTPMEESGLVDRERLLDFHGRRREPQFELARRYGLTGWSAPAGGCLLTFEDFAKKIEDLIAHEQFDRHTLLLVKTGRHFRLSPQCLLAMGKDDPENMKLESLAGPDDTVLRSTLPGPIGVLTGAVTEGDILLAAGLMGRYMKRVEDGVACEVQAPGLPLREIKVMPLSPVRADSYRI